MNAQLALRAITLRGIGPYLHGARLEIRPLTILCGMNGSGKSTWFKALNMLKESVHLKGFPFRWKADDWDANDIEVTSAFVHLQYEDHKYPFLTDENLAREFGPPGTIALQLECTQDFELPTRCNETIEAKSAAQSFLWLGHCERGMRFTVRLCHPTHSSSEEVLVDGLHHLVELRFDDELAIRFTTSNHRSKRYAIECSAGFMPQLSGIAPNQMAQVAECSDELNEISPVAGLLDREDAESFVVCAASRIQQLLREVLAGYFYLGAVRQAHPYRRLEDNESFDIGQAIATRYVGPQGQATWALEREFAYNEISPAPIIGPIAAAKNGLFERDFVSPWLERLLETSIQDQHSPPLAWTKVELPTAFLVSDHPRPDAERDAFDSTLDHDDLARIEHSCFGTEPQNPKQMSSGFHQLMPLVVQAGLMRQYEIMAVENPEVHLHPGLQLDVAEFLMRQASAGKWIMIETHSDLIIRRVIREILEEEIGTGQEKIGIYFANAAKSEPLNVKGFAHYREEQRLRYATIEPIQIDANGRIANWPRGFMDEDVRESRRLLDVMYPPTGMAEE